MNDDAYKKDDMQIREGNDFSNKKFKYLDKEISYEELYESLKKKESPFDSLMYLDVFSDSGIHLLCDAESYIKDKFFFADERFTLNIICSNKKTQTYSVYSTYEIYEIVKDYNLDNLYFNQDKYDKNDNYLLEKNNIINFYYDLDEFIGMPENDKKPKRYKYSEPILPKKLSKYYHLYFEDDNLSTKIIYYNTRERKSLFSLITHRLILTNKFLFVGPSGIGKSFFLLYLSRVIPNCIYINLKVIRNLINLKEYIKIKNVIAKECKRANLKVNEKKMFNKKIKEINEMNIPAIIKSLIDFFLNMDIIIILDQFKNDLSIDDIKLGKIKLIICSSINEKAIRQSCIENISNLLKGQKIDYNKYIYIPKLYQNDNENENEKKLFSYFNFIPKYISLIKNCKTTKEYDSKLSIIKSDIINRIKTFCGKSNFMDYLMKIRQYLNEFILITDFEAIINLYPLKLFIFQFYSEQNEENIILYNNEDLSSVKFFKVSYLFPFMEEIIEDIEMEEQNKFFTNGLFKSHTGSTIGGFFELVAIKAIKDKALKLPGIDNHYELRVARICDMNHIKPKISEYIKNSIVVNQIAENKITTNNQDMDIDNNNIFDYNKCNTIFESLNEKEKKEYKNIFIFQEDRISEIIQQYIESYNNLKIQDENGILFMSDYSRLFKTETKEKKLIKNKENMKTDMIKKDITIDIINKNYRIKENIILVTQTVENAAVYDLAYLYGQSQEKIFLGFQMKSYRDYIENQRTFSIKRDNIINKSKQLLLNSKYLLDINIVEWHYIIVGLYFDDNKGLLFEDNRTYSENLINYCQNNNLELILYEPIKKLFYYSNKTIISDTLSLSDISNIVGKRNKIYKFPKPDNCFLGKKRKIKRICESIEAVQIILSKEKIDKNNIITKTKGLCANFERKLNIKDLKFVDCDKYNENINFNPIPDDNYLIMFKCNNNINNNNHINNISINNNNIKLSDINNFCILIKKPKKNYMLYFPCSENKLEMTYVVQSFIYFDLTEKYFIFNFKEKENDKECKNGEEKSDEKMDLK